jgi:hypothetical protein
MTDSNEVFVPYGDSASDTATLLLAAAEEKGLDPGVVKSTSDGGFRVEKALASKAGVDFREDDDGEGDEDYGVDQKQADDDARLRASEEATRAAQQANTDPNQQSIEEQTTTSDGPTPENTGKTEPVKRTAKKSTARKTAAKKSTTKKGV